MVFTSKARSGALYPGFIAAYHKEKQLFPEDEHVTKDHSISLAEPCIHVAARWLFSGTNRDKSGYILVRCDGISNQIGSEAALVSISVLCHRC